MKRIHVKGDAGAADREALLTDPDLLNLAAMTSDQIGDWIENEVNTLTDVKKALILHAKLIRLIFWKLDQL